MKSTLALALLLALPAPSHAQTTPAAPARGFTVDTRLRLEVVDDKAFARDAEALTLRARLGWRSPVRSGWSGYAEFEGTTALVDDFNSTRNGRNSYPVVADPNKAEINQLYLNYQPVAGTRASFGRQRLNYDNQRFFGAVGWRQNEQTFDAIDAQHAFDHGLSLRYSYLDRVQRIFGNDHPNRNLARWDLDTHLLSASIQAGPGILTGYAHFIDNQTLPLSSHRNFGLRFVASGKFSDAFGWLATAEFAQQDDFADGASNIDADYLLAEGVLTIQSYTAMLGYERLGGDGNYAFQTPFATGHAFNGWADKFLTTPIHGLDDLYVSTGGPLATQGWATKANWLLVFHRYRADRGSDDYGQEWNAQLAFPITKDLKGLAKYADYRSDGFAFDTRKVWLQLEWKL